MSKLSGVWATYKYLDSCCHAVEAIRKKGIQPTVLSPCPRHEIDHALGEPQSRLPWISLAFGGLGTLTGMSFTAWTAQDWILPVSLKPVVAIPPFMVIGFELTILFAATFTLLGVILLSTIDTLRNPLPKGMKNHIGFQRDEFGVMLRCEPGKAKEFEELLKSHGAEEVHIEG